MNTPTTPRTNAAWRSARDADLSDHRIALRMWELCCQLERELESMTAQRDAVIHFCEAEMGWEYFRAECKIGNNPSNSEENAEKLREYLKLKGWKP